VVRYLLDTSALLAHHRQEAGWEKVQTLLESDDADIIVASVSLTELGRRLRELGATDAQVDATLSSYELLMSDIVVVDRAVARAAVRLMGQTPERLPLVVALIAAAAQTADAVLVHRDVHMRPIPVDLVRQFDLSAADSGE
jgi:predicted nucleic acid-binding protein